MSFFDEEAEKHPSQPKAAKAKKIYAVDGMSMLGFGPRTIKTAVEITKNNKLNSCY